MATQQDVIKNFMAVLDTTTAKGESALNEAISAVTNFATYAKFRTQLLSDCKAVDDADTFLRKYCGIILDNDDTGAITGSDAGGSTVKTAKSVVPEDTELIDFTGDEFTINGLTVKLGNADSNGNLKSARTFKSLSEHEKYLWQSIYTWWISGGLDLIAESYGDNYSFGSESSAVTKTLWIVLANENTNNLAATWGGPTGKQRSTNDLQLHINLKYYSKATGEDGDPQNGQKYLDRVIAHELTHAVMRANIDWFDYLPGFIKEGMAELTHGIDDARTAAIKTLAGDSSKLGSVLSTSTGTVTVSGVSSGASYAGGYIFLRYLAHQNADLTVTNSTASTSVETFYGNDTIINSASNVTISAGMGNDSIIGGGKKNFYVYTGGNDIIENFGDSDTLSITSEFYSKTNGDDVIFVTDDGTVTLTGAANLSTLNVTGEEIADPDTGILTVTDSRSSPVTINVAIEAVDASTRTKDVKITGNSRDNTITGGSGNDTLDGGKGDDVLTGGNGADIFILSAGNDTITDYGTGADKISLDSASVKNFGADGDNFIFDFGNRSLTLTDAADKKISVISGKVTNIFSDEGIFNSAGTAVTLNTSTKNFTADSTIVTIDASLTSDATVTGNAKANTLIGSDGQTTLTGGAGNDLFINAGGEDFITDYGNGSDKISLGSSLKSFSVTDGNVELELATGSVTIANGSGKKISLVSGGKTATNIFTEGGILNAAGTAVTLNTSTKDYTASTNVVTIDAGLTSGATVTGNTKANKVSLGSDNVFVWTKGGNDTIENFGTDDTLKISGTVSSVSTSGKNTIVKIGSNKITVKDSSQVTFSDNGGTKIFSGGIFYDENKTSATLTAAVNSYTAPETVTSITGNAKNNTLKGSSTGTMTLTGGKGNDLFINAGGNDYITDYGNGSDKISLGSSLESFSVTGKDVALNLAKGSVKIANGSGKKISLVSGGKTTANIFTDGGILNAAGTAVTLNASTKNYTATSKIVTINAGLTSNATITGNSKANKVTFGSGENVFVWAKGGNDTLMNFGADDTLSVSGTVTDGSVKSGTSYLKVGSNKITVKNSSVNIDDNGGIKYFSAGVFYDDEETSVTLGSAVSTYKASENVTNVTGNTKKNKLYAGDSDTTLTGGKGNDSLWGGSGSDKFIYNKGDGKDYIFGFDDTDMLEIIGLSGNVTGSLNKAGTELTVKVGSTAVAVLKNYTATDFTINGTDYTLNGKTLTK